MVFDAMVWGKKICAKWENNTDGSWKYRVRDYILMNDAVSFFSYPTAYFNLLVPRPCSSRRA